MFRCPSRRKATSVLRCYAALAAAYLLPLLALLAFAPGCRCSAGGWAFGDAGAADKVLLRDVQVLTLHSDRPTTGRRSSPVPQLKCVGGSAGGLFRPQVVQCYNRGFDGTDVQWECKADMDNAYRFGRVQVSCEGYDHRDDPYVLKGSCGLEYTLDHTLEGQQRQKREHNYYGGGDNSDSTAKKMYDSGGGNNNAKKPSNWSVLADFIGLSVVCIVIYAFYKTCIEGGSGRTIGDNPYSTTDDGTYPAGSPGGGGWSNPSAGGTNGYNHGAAGHSSATHCGAEPRQRGTGGGGFWTGMSTGGLLGYIFGNSSRPWSGYEQTSRNWGWAGRGGGGAQSSAGESRRRPGGSSGNGGAGASGGSSGNSDGGASTGTRTASGFGGTSRR